MSQTQEDEILEKAKVFFQGEDHQKPFS